MFSFEPEIEKNTENIDIKSTNPKTRFKSAVSLTLQQRKHKQTKSLASQEIDQQIANETLSETELSTIKQTVKKENEETKDNKNEIKQSNNSKIEVSIENHIDSKNISSNKNESTRVKFDEGQNLEVN